MNKARRQELARICVRLEDALSDLEAVQAEEENSRDNTPESLQGTDRYAESDAACDNLVEAVSELETAIGLINELAE